MATVHAQARPEDVERANVLTTREAAEILGVSLKSVQHWCEAGSLDSWKTAGGHRRVLRSSVENLMRTRQSSPPRASEFVPGGIERGMDRGIERGAEGSLTVYVVEDDPVYQKVYRTRISAWIPQPRLLTFASGYEALVRIGQEVPDLLITDVRMPGMSGIEMLKVLQRMPECAGMEVIAVTGLSEEDLAALGGLPPGVTCMHKPPRFEEIEQIAQSLGSTLTR